MRICDVCGPQPEQGVMDCREEKEFVWGDSALSCYLMESWVMYLVSGEDGYWSFSFFRFRLSKRVPMETQSCNMLLAIQRLTKLEKARATVKAGKYCLN